MACTLANWRHNGENNVLLPWGRWATQTDRDAFLAGYEQANLEIAKAGSQD
jgi:hypothetical protein